MVRLTTKASAFLQCTQDVFSRVDDFQWLGWGTLLLPGLKKVMEDGEVEHEQWACLEEDCMREEAAHLAAEE